MNDNCGGWGISMDVASGCCCKEVYRFLIILLIPTPLVLALFCSSILTSLFIFKCFLFLFMLFLCNIANVAQRTFEMVQKSRSHEHGNIIICLLIALIDQISFLSL